MSSKNVKIVKDNFAGIARAFEGIANRGVFIGIPEDKSQRKEGAISNAEIGYIQDKGSPAAGIPPREWLEPAVKDIEKDAIKVLEQGARDVFTKPAALDQALNKVGLMGQTAAKKKITAGLSPELLEATLKARARKGFKGTKPLIVTGEVLNSISYDIRKVSK